MFDRYLERVLTSTIPVYEAARFLEGRLATNNDGDLLQLMR